MISSNLNEIDIVQNSTLAAALIWQCGLGFQRDLGTRMPLPVAFLVLPICMHQSTRDVVLSTQRRSGLLMFTSKVAKRKEDLYAIHLRALKFRDLTFDSIGLGIETRLVSVDYTLAQIRSNTHTQPENIPDRIRLSIRAAEKFGSWCSRLSLEQIASTLRVNY